MLPLFDHQVEIIKQAQGKKFFALFCDMGTGKTRCAIELIKYPIKYHYPQFKTKTLVIAPNTILENWLCEVERWSNLKAVILQGSRTKRIKLLKEPADIYIINYEALRILEPELAAMNFDMIISDELQKLKGHRSLQSKAAFRLAQKIPYKLGMTGTPITNSPIDLFAEFRFLNPYIFGFSFFRFRNRYCVMGGYFNKEIKGYINLDEMQEKIRSCSIRVNKNDCLNLPDKIYQVHQVDMGPEQARVYHDLRKEFIAEIQGKIVTAPYVLTRLIRLSQCTAGFCKTEEHEEINFETNPKLQLLKEIIEDLPKDEKVVIFCRFLKEIKNLELLCSKQGWPWVTICGETKNRQEQILAFNDPAGAKIFIGQIQTAGLGINLQSARYCIFLSNSYSHGERMQAEDRLHRIGQKNNVTYIDILARNSIDQTILNCLKEKKDLATEIIEIIKIQNAVVNQKIDSQMR